MPPETKAKTSVKSKQFLRKYQSKLTFEGYAWLRSNSVKENSGKELQFEFIKRIETKEDEE